MSLAEEQTHHRRMEQMQDKQETYTDKMLLLSGIRPYDGQISKQRADEKSLFELWGRKAPNSMKYPVYRDIVQSMRKGSKGAQTSKNEDPPM